jgi:hypothetical protein
MIKKCGLVFSSLLSLAAPAAPARGQDFVLDAAGTPLAGELRLAAHPIGLFSKTGGPDRLGVAWSAGYGATDGLDVEAKTAVFDGFGLVGLGAGFRVLHGPVDLTLRLGGHKAFVQSAPNSTSFDAAWLAGVRPWRRVRIAAGMGVSLESLDGVPNSRFERVYVVPGFDWRVSRRMALLSRAGLGLNQDSPSYLTAGLSLDLPTGRSRGRDEQLW